MMKLRKFIAAGLVAFSDPQARPAPPTRSIRERNRSNTRPRPAGRSRSRLTAGSPGSRATSVSAGRTTHVDESFGDILDNLDIAVMGVAEARYERFGVFTDLVYVRLSDSGDTPFGILASSVDFTTQSLMWTAAGEYRLLDQPDASVDAFAGFRLFSVKNELDFNPPGLLGGLELSQTETWADPIVGLKGRAFDHAAILPDGLGR